ncbi:glycosyltransferase family 39 protein [Ethanoligenens sp.]|uniref:glycosyltransferase family 39 protein n=1 Tax=Ethanoligenens sp. TaxID=2099655 RepID=UPI0039E8903A
MKYAVQKKCIKHMNGGLWPYIGIAGILAVSFLLFNHFPILWIKIGMASILIGLGILLVIWYAGRRLSSARLLTVIFAAGLVLRIGYMLYTPYALRGHDIGTFFGYQNAGYITTIFLKGQMPSTNIGMFYHPPVAFFLDAVVMKGYALLTPGKGLSAWMEAAKLVPGFASCALLVVCLRFFRELGLPRRAMLIAMPILAFQPTFFILSASINNDMLMIFFVGLSLLYTVKWYKQQTIKNILILAVVIALAITSKASGGLAALLTAGIFLMVLLRQVGQKRKLFAQFSLFAMVCLPLGLWYAVRNRVLFGQSFGYVLPMSTEGPLYVGGHSLVSRFLSFPIHDLFTNPFCNPYGDYNLWIYLVKCSLFGEFSFDSARLFAAPLLVLNLILIVLSIAAMIWVLRAKDMPRLSRFLLGGLWLLQMGSFLVFNFKYPFGCTMDFRYIVPTLIAGAGFMGLAADRMRRLYPEAARRVLPVVGCLIAAFAIVSALFYVS